MTEKCNRTSGADRPTAIPAPSQALGSVDRRGFLRGAAVLAAGGLSATGGQAQSAAARDSTGGAPPVDAARQLREQTQRAQRWARRDPSDWVRARQGVDHNVVIVGGGQSGVAIAYGLKRRGVGRVEVIDQAE
ncbi:MAG: hypothetical protein OXF98_04575, partial [Rhodospirillaceae bacterium]|nr:hypothetical protein [Rhodospirillaceae bacterium]